MIKKLVETSLLIWSSDYLQYSYFWCNRLTTMFSIYFFLGFHRLGYQLLNVAHFDAEPMDEVRLCLQYLPIHCLWKCRKPNLLGKFYRLQCRRWNTTKLWCFPHEFDRRTTIVSNCFTICKRSSGLNLRICWSTYRWKMCQSTAKNPDRGPINLSICGWPLSRPTRSQTKKKMSTCLAQINFKISASGIWIR